MLRHNFFNLGRRTPYRLQKVVLLIYFLLCRCRIFAPGSDRMLMEMSAGRREKPPEIRTYFALMPQSQWHPIRRWPPIDARLRPQWKSLGSPLVPMGVLSGAPLAPKDLLWRPTGALVAPNGAPLAFRCRPIGAPLQPCNPTETH